MGSPDRIRQFAGCSYFPYQERGAVNDIGCIHDSIELIPTCNLIPYLPLCVRLILQSQFFRQVLFRTPDGGARLAQVGGAKVLPGVTFTAKTGI